MKELRNMDEAEDFWNERGGSTVNRKHEYRSKKFPDQTIYTKHGPEYIPAIIHTVRAHSPKIFIELGTFMGGLTLALHEEFPEMKIFTFDVFLDVDEEKKKLLFNKNVKFFQEDLLGSENARLVNIIKHTPGKKLLYCDNGNKEYEINAYAKYLLSGDALGCHDWLVEVNPENIRIALREFRPFDRKMYLNNEGTIYSRFWIKKKR